MLVLVAFYPANSCSFRWLMFWPHPGILSKYKLYCSYRHQGSSVVDAASIGAVSAAAVIAHILVTVIAFISLLAFLNATLTWFGDRVGLCPPDYPPLTFQVLMNIGYVSKLGILKKGSSGVDALSVYSAATPSVKGFFCTSSSLFGL